MNNYDGTEIAVNESILRLIQPYSDNEITQLKQSRLVSPNTRIIHIWNGYHLDDIEVYRICKELNLAHEIMELQFPDLNHAAIYVCRRQLKRHDISSEYKKYLIGQRYYYEHEKRAAINTNDAQYVIAEMLASELYISVGTVRKYSIYASAMNDIFEQDTVFAKSILTGKIRISHENTIELARLRPEEIRAVAKSSMEEKIDHITLSYIRNEVKWSHIQTRSPVSRRERSEEKARSKIAIRQMPEYDPDAEVNSLCLTVDYWISSMKRVKNSDSFPKITVAASLRLMKKLSVLEHTINLLQDSLVERTTENG